MRKFNRVLSTIALTITTLVGLPYGVSQVSIAQTRPAQRQFLWWRIFQNNPPLDETPGGKRGDFCAIAPLFNHQIWSDRPLLVWQGNVGRIGIRAHNSEDMLWSQTVTSVNSPVMYRGEPLKSGQTYDWVFYDKQDNRLFWVPFKIMEAQERDRIRVRLTILGQQLKETGSTPEEIANARANYFAQKQLWSDVLQEVYSVENPSAQLQEILQAIPTQLCSPPTQSE